MWVEFQWLLDCNGLLEVTEWKAWLLVVVMLSCYFGDGLDNQGNDSGLEHGVLFIFESRKLCNKPRILLFILIAEEAWNSFSGFHPALTCGSRLSYSCRSGCGNRIRRQNQLQDFHSSGSINCYRICTYDCRGHSGRLSW